VCVCVREREREREREVQWLFVSTSGSYSLGYSQSKSHRNMGVIRSLFRAIDVSYCSASAHAQSGLAVLRQTCMVWHGKAWCVKSKGKTATIFVAPPSVTCSKFPTGCLHALCTKPITTWILCTALNCVCQVYQISKKLSFICVEEHMLNVFKSTCRSQVVHRWFRA
jgi:hypothetical protein